MIHNCEYGFVEEILYEFYAQMHFTTFKVFCDSLAREIYKF